MFDFKSTEVKENIFTSVLAVDAVLKIKREHVHGGNTDETKSCTKVLVSLQGHFYLLAYLWKQVEIQMLLDC